jgi:glc operon protein GlcG
MKTTPVLTHADALAILETLRKALEHQESGASVAIVDSHGELIAFLRTDGCPLPSINNAINKAFTAAREGLASKEIGNASRLDPFPMTNFGDLRYTGWGGGLPLRVGTAVVGAIGVSGLPEQEDMDLAARGAHYFELNIEIG